MTIFRPSTQVFRPMTLNSETQDSLIHAPDASEEPELVYKPSRANKSASRYIRDRFTNNKRKGGGGLGASVFYGFHFAPKETPKPEKGAPAGTLDLHMDENEMDQEQEQHGKEAGGIDIQNPGPDGLPRIDDDSGRPNKSPRLEYDSQRIQALSPKSKTRSFVAAITSGMRSCIADVDSGSSTNSRNRRTNLKENRKPAHHSSPRSCKMVRHQPKRRTPKTPGILAPPHHSLPPISAQSVARNLAGERAYQRANDEFQSFSSLGLADVQYMAPCNCDRIRTATPVPTPTFPPFGFPTQPALQSVSSMATIPENAPPSLELVNAPVVALSDAERDALFEEIFGDELRAAGIWSSTPALQPSGLPMVGQHPSPSEDGELESPPVDAHPPLMIDSAPTPEIEAGSSSRDHQTPVAQSTTLSPPSKKGLSAPSSQLQVGADRTVEATQPGSEQGFLTPIERPTREPRERTISGLIRRYSLLEVQVDDPLPPAASHSLTEIGRHTRELDLRRRSVDREASFHPNFTFPARPPTPRSPAGGSLENALELTINGRAPPRPTMATIELPAMTAIELPTDQELRAMFDMDSVSSQWSPDDSQYASSTDVDEVLQRRNSESIDHTEYLRTLLAESQASAQVMDPARRLPNTARGAFTTIPEEPETPPRWILRDDPDETPARLRAPRSTPRSFSEPAVRYSSFRTQQSIRSVQREDSLAPKDFTIGTEAIRYLSTADLHPEFKARYIITEMLGAGGYGFVCIAETTGYGGMKAGVEVAVKFLFKRRPNSDQRMPIQMIEDMPFEAFLLRHMDHGGIIDCYDLFEDPMMYYMILELHGHAWERQGRDARAAVALASRLDAKGQEINPFTRPDMPRRASHDLFEAIEHNSFTLLQSKNIFLQIVDAVDYMHRRGIFHRDLKDENVVIDKQLQVKLIDFGSAVMEDLAEPRTIYIDEFKGTEAYAPPEVFTCGSYEAADTDIWALGILCAVLTSGDPPIKEQNGRIRPDRPRLHRHVDPDAYDLICKCMLSDPRKRISIDGIISHKWLNSLSCDAPPSAWTNGSRYRVNSDGELLEGKEVFEEPETSVEMESQDVDEELLKEIDLMAETGFED